MIVIQNVKDLVYRALGYYTFGYTGVPYIRINDGSSVPGEIADTTGVLVLKTNTDIYNVNVGDQVSVTGVSSILKPSGSSDTFRSVLTYDGIQNLTDGIEDADTGETDADGVITGTVKVYDVPVEVSEKIIHVYSNLGKSATLTIARPGNPTAPWSGSASYTLTGIHRTAYDSLFGGLVYPKYIISAKCDGYKTRTCTNINWNANNSTTITKNFYLTPLQKVYATTSSTSLSYCGTPKSATITATAVNADRSPRVGATVRFRTDKGSFSSTLIPPVHETSGITNSSGQATAVLYDTPQEYGNAVVEVTDDSAPELGDNINDDIYKYDWEQVHDQYGYPVKITMAKPTVTLQISPTPITATECENQKTVTATLKVCGVAKSNEVITFHTTNGKFLESGSATAQRTTNTSGVATATLLRPTTCVYGADDVYAEASGFGIETDNIPVTWDSWTLKVTASPDWVVRGNPATVKARLTQRDGTTPVIGQSVTLTTDHGSLNPHDAGNSQQYTANTNASGEISTTLTVSECPVTATVTGQTTTCSSECLFTDSDSLLVICSENDVKTLIIALDGTGSMDSGLVAADGMTLLTQDLKALGKALKVGAVRFGDYVADAEYGTPNPDNSILMPTSDYDAVSYWILNAIDGADNGGDYPENCLLALVTAKNIGGSGCYIALATDDTFHYAGDGSDVTTLVVGDVISLLSEAGCKVYIDAKTEAMDAYYTTPNLILHVNGEMEDWNVPDSDHYKFPKLKAALLQ